MSTVYNMGEVGDPTGNPQSLTQTFKAQRRPDGRVEFTLWFTIFTNSFRVQIF